MAGATRPASIWSSVTADALVKSVTWKTSALGRSCGSPTSADSCRADSTNWGATSIDSSATVGTSTPQ